MFQIPYKQLTVLSPLLLPLISLILSISICFHYLENNLGFGFVFLFWGTFLSLLFYSQKTFFYQSVILCFVIALGGWLRTIQLNHFYDQFVSNTAAQKTTCCGYVVNSSISSQFPMKYCLTLHITTIADNRLEVPAQIQIYTSHYYDLEIGDFVELRNIAFKQTTNKKFHNYLRKEGIVATLFAAQIEYTLISRPTYHLARGLSLLKKRILYSFKQTLSKSTFTLFASLFLGEKKTNQHAIEKLQRQFKQWGILHILARSGLHLVMVLSAYEYVFRYIPLPLSYKTGILLFLNFIYFALSWSSISFIRAFLIFLLYKIFSLLYLPTHFLHILLLVCIAVLLYNPMQLFFIDFQLSFGLTFALGWLSQYKVAQNSS